MRAVFANELRQFEAHTEEERLIDALSGSSSSRAVKQAESALVACHRAIEKERAAQQVEHVVRAIEAGKDDDFAVQARVRPILQQVLRDPARLSSWITEVDALLESRTVAQQEQELGQAYRFADVEPGQYTLLAKSAIETMRPKVWLIPLQVNGQVAQDLVAATARDVPLRKTLENVLLGENG